MSGARSPVDGLEALLDRQREALVRGDIAALGGMASELESETARLRTMRADKPDLARLARKSARNARLLAAARSGVAQARARRSSGDGACLTTYDARGRQMGGCRGGQTLSRR